MGILKSIEATMRRTAGRVMHPIISRIEGQQLRIQEQKILAAKVLINQLKAKETLSTIQEAEFKVFSQFGDDGIIQYLIHQVEVEPHLQNFIEFGVENYTESNTRFLLVNNNWRGLVMDSGSEYIRYIQEDDIYWRHDLTAVQAFVNKDNINSLISTHGFGDEIGLLSIDIDGGDFWIWDSIQVSNPIIVIIEYNSVFGEEHAITIPYDPKFQRSKAHYSNLFYGCSLKALCLLAEKKGYSFVGSNSNGNNAYFIRKDKVGKLPVLTVREGYVASKFRESRHPTGQLSYVSGQNRISVIQDMIVFDVERDRLVRIKELIR